jgi:beta-phosphoglucomutase-like phosphatase (HAD superfamily)
MDTPASSSPCFPGALLVDCPCPSSRVQPELAVSEDSWELWQELAAEHGLTPSEQLEFLARHLSSDADGGGELVLAAKKAVRKARQEALENLVSEALDLISALNEHIHQLSDAVSCTDAATLNATITKVLWVRETLETLFLKIR